MESESFYISKKERRNMNKRLLELLDKINAKKLEVKNLAEQGKLEEAKAAKQELQNMQTQFDLLKDLDDEALIQASNAMNGGTGVIPIEKKDSVKEFAEAARNGFRNAAMREGAQEDGGYTVPEDIQTQINTYRDSKFSLLRLVRVEKVTTNKGSRTFKKRSQQTGFTKVGEGGKIPGKTTPKFTRVDYEIGKYAGYFPVTNELLSDTDANIVGILTEWIGDESRVTANNLIIQKIYEKAPVDLKNLDGIKKAVNVDLGSVFKATTKIVTNDNGLQYLDALKDNSGKYLLTPDPAVPMQMRLAIGATFIPVEVIANDDLANREVYVKTKDTDVVSGKIYYTKSEEIYTKVDSPVKTNIGTYYEIESRIPMIIGDLKEGIYYFDRAQRSIMVTTTASVGDLNAFEEDLTIYRAIEREDVKTRDEKAFVNGYIVA